MFSIHMPVLLSRLPLACQDESKAATNAIVRAIRIALLDDRPDMPLNTRKRLWELTDEEFIQDLYVDEALKDIRFYKKTEQGDQRGVAYPNKGKKRNRQGVPGMTTESGMVDLWAIDPTALCKVIKCVCRALNRQLGIGKERVSIRSNMSNELSAHHDCPLFKRQRIE